MSEFVALSAACNVIQLVEVSWTVITRLIDYSQGIAHVPRDLRATLDSLPLLARKLKTLQAVPYFSASADSEVKTVLEGFNAAVTDLEIQVARILPLQNDTRKLKLRKAIRSLTSADQLKVAVAALDQYKSTLTFYFQSVDAVSASFRALVVKRGKAYFNGSKLDNDIYGEKKELWGVRSNAWRDAVTISAMNDVIASLMCKRGRLNGTSVVTVADEYRYLGFDMNAVCKRICGELWQAGQIEVVIHVSSRSIKALLSSLEIPLSGTATEEEQWKILGAVLEEWQRPFLLIVSNDFWQSAKHETLYLPRSGNGYIMFVRFSTAGRGRSCWRGVGHGPLVEFNTKSWPDSKGKVHERTEYAY